MPADTNMRAHTWSFILHSALLQCIWECTEMPQLRTWQQSQTQTPLSSLKGGSGFKTNLSMRYQNSIIASCEGW